MKWEKQGLIFCADNHAPWMVSHASNPVARHVHDDIYKIYFSSRNKHNQSSICCLEIDIKSPTEVLSIFDKPVLSPGECGLFDDAGASMGCFLDVSGETYLYYLGWTLTKSAPWHNSIGLAKEKADGTFSKVSLAPIVDRSDADPFSLSYPWIMKSGETYHMWYGSNLSWGHEQKDMAHLIKYASSYDPFCWKPTGKIALEFRNTEEYAMSKPCVIRDPECWKMWYSYRGHAYRIGYAESMDGANWTRKDSEVGITVSSEGWDSETVEYPNVFDHKGKRYMLYNGNRYGLTGFGIAQLVESL
ncbi:MAG: hypothetical protein R3A11_05380 [Bdellovibrionota bacterium]